MAPTPDVLRLHGPFQHVDWAQNVPIHPHYENPAAYFTYVPSVHARGALLQPPSPIARGTSDHDLSCSRLARSFIIGNGHGKGPYAALSFVIKAQICDRWCLSNAAMPHVPHEQTIRRGSIKGPFRVDGHLQAPLKVLFLSA